MNIYDIYSAFEESKLAKFIDVREIQPLNILIKEYTILVLNEDIYSDFWGSSSFKHEGLLPSTQPHVLYGRNINCIII